ncbi:MAG TPA: hypothetical protein VFT99_07645, partial [Roseiflexaceae bacterium]|nr:hypothetical protein [Roseiflexaceae bacterium]
MTQAAMLIIENDQVVAESVRDTLLCLGYSVTGIAQNAEQANALFSAAPPDLVLINLECMRAADD